MDKRPRPPHEMGAEYKLLNEFIKRLHFGLSVGVDHCIEISPYPGKPEFSAWNNLHRVKFLFLGTDNFNVFWLAKFNKMIGDVKCRMRAARVLHGSELASIRNELIATQEHKSEASEK